MHTGNKSGLLLAFESGLLGLEGGGVGVGKFESHEAELKGLGGGDNSGGDPGRLEVLELQVRSSPYPCL